MPPRCPATRGGQEASPCIPSPGPRRPPRQQPTGQTLRSDSEAAPGPPASPTPLPGLGLGERGRGTSPPTTAPTAPGQGPAAPAHETRGPEPPALTGKRSRVLAPARPPESGESPRASGAAAAETPSPPPAQRSEAAGRWDSGSGEPTARAPGATGRAPSPPPRPPARPARGVWGFA